MARRGILGAILHDLKVAERERQRAHRAAVRDHEAALRRAERARAAQERAHERAHRAALAAANRSDREAEAERKRFEKEMKAAHIAAMEAEAEERNAALAETFDELATLLAATLEVDDYVDLESLRRTPRNWPFMRTDLEQATPAPAAPAFPPEPIFREPPPVKGLLGRKKRQRAALDAATQRHEERLRAWRQEVDQIQLGADAEAARHREAETLRQTALAAARAEHQQEIDDHNASLDALIANLGYGTTEAVEEYVSIVLANSVYPACFAVDYDHSFEPSHAELTLTVFVPEPQTIAWIKHYKYRKSSDEIVETALPAKTCREKYADAVHQVALRSLHEVFEADRRGLIRSIALQVGTHTTDPATGLPGFRPFVAVAAKRDTFIQFDLSAVVPTATLEHLGAAISKDPFNLIPADVTGVRRS